MFKKKTKLDLEEGYLYEHYYNKGWMADIISIIDNAVLYKIIEDLHITKEYKIRSTESFTGLYKRRLCKYSDVDHIIKKEKEEQPRKEQDAL